MSYTIGQLVHLSVAFKVGATLTDPTTIVLTIKDPAGAITTPTVPAKDSTGNYHYDLSVTLAGTYWYTWAGTGTCQASTQNAFDVAGGHTT
jgi:hypothetical protein